MIDNDGHRQQRSEGAARVDGDEVPREAMAALLELEKIDNALPTVVVARLAAVRLRPCASPLTWAEVIDDPIIGLVGTYVGEGTELPVGVYDVGEGYPVACFELSAQAKADLATWCELVGVEDEQFTVRFGEQELARAFAAGAVLTSRHGWHHVIVGARLGSELASMSIARELGRQLAIADGR